MPNAATTTLFVLAKTTATIKEKLGTTAQVCVIDAWALTMRKFGKL